MDRHTISLTLVLLTVTMLVTRGEACVKAPGVQDLMERIDRLEATNREQTKTIKMLEADNAALRELKKTMTEIKAEMKNMTEIDNNLFLKADNAALRELNNTMTEIKAEMENMKIDSNLADNAVLGELNNTMTEIKAEMENRKIDSNVADNAALGELNNTMTEIKAEMENMKIDSNLSSQLDNLTNSVTAVKQCTESRVAFTAGLSVYDAPVAYNKVVVYNKEIYNLGNAYSTATGKFTCPVAGLYGFTVNLMSSEGDKQACVVLKLNSRDRITQAYTKDANNRASDSNSARLHLDVGDEVYLTACGTSYLYTSSTPTNTFTGVLLSADTCV